MRMIPPLKRTESILPGRLVADHSHPRPVMRRAESGKEDLKTDRVIENRSHVVEDDRSIPICGDEVEQADRCDMPLVIVI